MVEVKGWISAWKTANLGEQTEWGSEFPGASEASVCGANNCSTLRSPRRGRSFARGNACGDLGGASRRFSEYFVGAYRDIAIGSKDYKFVTSKLGRWLFGKGLRTKQTHRTYSSKLRRAVDLSTRCTPFLFRSQSTRESSVGSRAKSVFLLT